MIFRLHYTDGTTLDVEADTPDQARKIAKGQRDGTVRKVKALRSKDDG